FAKLTLMYALAALPSPGAADVVLEGVSDRQALNIKVFLGLSDLECDAPPWLVRWQFRQADSEISGALEALGYYGAQIVKDLDLPTDGCWRARFQITPGEPVIVRQVDVVIDAPLRSESMIATQLMKAQELKDKPLDHAAYEELKGGLLAAAQALGYFDASFVVSEVKVDAVAQRATVSLDLVGGNRYTFGDIEIVGDVLERRLIDAYIPFRTGEPFDVSLVARLRRNLADSGYFGRTSVVADTDATVDRAVPIRIDLFPRARDWTYMFGFGYATDTGARLRADAENNLLNRRGHRASVRSVLSTERSSLDLQYRMPHRNPLDDWITFDAGLAHLESDTSTSDIKRLGVRHSYLQGEWVQTDFADLTHEDFKIGDEYGKSRLVLLGTTFSRFRRDQPTRPTRGYRVDATLRGASQSLGSDTDFVQVRLGGRVIVGLSQNLRAIARTTAGWTWEDNFSDLPPSIRFFAGGDTSIRGYAFESIGPEQDGNVIGGSRLLTGSLEFDYQFRPNWSVATFVDSGSAYDNTPQFFTGVGAGIRWFSPLGPIRIDVAHPLDDPSKQWRLYVTIGPDL
ncbi:MAG: autotransporter assembly complex protein TamA, partial [Proteobacteria bacterium]|nr:autotransporter assembly complex protein TamA [Pseudomonadota bacterium]